MAACEYERCEDKRHDGEKRDCDCDDDPEQADFAVFVAQRGQRRVDEQGKQRIQHTFYRHFVLSSQNATALAAATLRESTSWSMGIFTV